MPNNAETIEKLAKQLEQQKFLNELQSCNTLEDFQELVKKYVTICENQKWLFGGEIMGQTDIQFKDNLRKDLITFKHLKELLDSDKKEELAKALDQEIERINASLQD